MAKKKTDKKVRKLARRILKKFGPAHQATILIEEMAELTKVLCKMQRGRFDREKLSEEYAHVQVSCQVIELLLDIRDADIREQVEAKLRAYADG